MTLTPTGFWSYAHVDDDASDGHVRALATQVANSFRLLTGTKLDLFFDRDSISWGDEWQQKIDSSIHGTTFFIPIITPSYLLSSACREEFLLFWSKSSTSGLGELLLPIIYAPVEFDLDSDDEIVAIVSKIQGEFWYETRLEDESSSIYKKSVNKLASRLKEIADLVESKPEVAGSVAAISMATVDLESGEDEPGLIDIIADVEGAIPRWSEAIEGMATGMSDIEVAVSASQSALDKAGKSKSLGPRIVAIRAAAERLDAPTAAFKSSAKEYQSEAIAIDHGINAMIQLAKMSNDEEERRSAAELANSIRSIYLTVEEIMDQVEGFLELLRDIAKMSRDMRKPTTRIADGFRMVKDTQVIFENWIRGLENIDDDLG